MKRYIVLILSCLIAGVASAQQTLEQKVSRAIEKTPAQARVSAERDFIQYYLDGDIENVDRMLMQEPLLANASIQRENGQRIPMVYAAFLKDNTSMLKVFYKHGAECEQCLKESFTSNPKPKQKLTLQYQLPMYVKKHWAELAPVYKQLVKELPQVSSMEFPQVSAEFLGKKYEPKTSGEANAMLEELYARGKETRNRPKEVYSQWLRAIILLEDIRPHLVKYEKRIHLAKVQPVPSPVEFPQVSVEFLGKKYEPQTSAEIERMIKAVQAAYQNEVDTKYLPYGNKDTAGLTAQRDSAIARLEQARPQLVKYEERVQQRANIQDNNRKVKDAADKQITQALKMFHGQVDLVVKFFQHFPKEDVFRWSYYMTGANLMDIDFQIPVLYSAKGAKKWTVYDARPETFGTQVYYRVLGDIKNNNDAQEALAIFAGSSVVPDERLFWGRQGFEILAVYQNQRDSKEMRVIAYELWAAEGDSEGVSYQGWSAGVSFWSIKEGEREERMLQVVSGGVKMYHQPLKEWKKGTETVESWKKQMEKEGYTLIWEAK